VFERAVIEGLLREAVTVPHSATILSPYSFGVAPEGLGLGAEYTVLAERSAFELKVQVTTPYLGGGVRAAIVAGVRANPARLEKLDSALSSNGWETRLEVNANECRIEAKQDGVLELGSYDLSERAVSAAVLMSEFVLDQLVVTRPYGEVRPAVLRHVSEELEQSDPWLYDPEERDRSTAVHRALENWLISRLTESGCQPLDAASEPLFDVAWMNGPTLWVCEVKSTVNSETNQLRLGVGQLLHYLAQIESVQTSPTAGALLVPHAPSSRIWFDIAARLGITILWPEAWDDLADRLVGHRT
jgi:hypothetical protein